MEDTKTRPLAVLRAKIDAVDREMLGLLAKRMAIVAEVAEHKREHQVKIRDARRERDVIDDRRARAERLGLPPGVVESIYRLVLLLSRDRQAELRAEVPLDIAPRTVAVIGGKGAMGRRMASIFADLGHEVIIADVDSTVSIEETAAAADVVVVSVPIRVTEEVIARVGPRVREDALLMDVTSLKEAPMRAMLASTKASVVGTHPMFGPGVHTLQGQRVVVCPARGDAWATWVRDTLASRGLVISEATPEQHDRVMAIVQVLTHYETQVAGLALARLGVPLAETLRFTSPVYLMGLYTTGRHFAQSPDLYGPIEMLNPRREEITATFQAAAAEVAAVLASGDQSRFATLFTEVRTFFGDFTDTALEQSSFLIDRLVERS